MNTRAVTIKTNLAGSGHPRLNRVRTRRSAQSARFRLAGKDACGASRCAPLGAFFDAVAQLIEGPNAHPRPSEPEDLRAIREWGIGG
jgi:hypothetical protein